MELRRRSCVGDALREAGQWSLDGPARRFDAQDWWYRLHFDVPDLKSAGQWLLGFEGLATLAQVWLNGAPILSSNNMFLAHQCEVGSTLREKDNELVLVFRSLDEALAKRRPRPRWKAPMVEHQQLRWTRTTLLGRTPGWSPPAQLVGPWRPVWLRPLQPVELESAQLRPSVQEGKGRVEIAVVLRSPVKADVASVTLFVSPCESGDPGAARAFELTRLPAGEQWGGSFEMGEVQLWWPHTHGHPARYQATLEVRGQVADGNISFDLGALGFRDLALDDENQGFGLSVNGTPVFCRGACWTPLDIVALDGQDRDTYARAIAQVREAGMNMIRVTGAMSYEADAFYDECDRQGVLVWQDFMFANMDYPEDDQWVLEVQREALQQLQRWQGRPCLAVLCGNSEVEQQAAMFGAARERWAPALFHDTLATLSRQVCPDVPYWPSSAHGGDFPHQPSAGTASYYGVGAYQRPLEDARRSEVRFATECLALANVPEAALLASLPGGQGVKVHHPGWKARVPRDLGAGWDFDDVRDHYLAELFAVDPARLRYSDHERYLLLSRVVSGEVMAAAFAEWRSPRARCRGALVWFLRDLWPGAGWGLIDAQGRPKAAYYYLRRALQSVSLAITDEGANGLEIHVSNERPQPLRATLEVRAWRHGQVEVGKVTQEVVLGPRQAVVRPMTSGFDWFADWSWAYRFGPVPAQVITARLLDSQGGVMARAESYPAGRSLPLEAELGLKGEATMVAPGVAELRVSTERFAQAVHFDVPGFLPDDAYFHLAPGELHTVKLTALAPDGSAPLAGQLSAVNTDMPVSIVVQGARQ